MWGAGQPGRVLPTSSLAAGRHNQVPGKEAEPGLEGKNETNINTQ